MCLSHKLPGRVICDLLAPVGVGLLLQFCSTFLEVLAAAERSFWVVIDFHPLTGPRRIDGLLGAAATSAPRQLTAWLEPPQGVRQRRELTEAERRQRGRLAANSLRVSGFLNGAVMELKGAGMKRRVEKRARGHLAVVFRLLAVVGCWPAAAALLLWWQTRQPGR